MLVQHSLQSWLIFHGIVFALLALDLGVFNRRQHVIHMKEALKWSLFWIGIGLSFSFYIYYDGGKQATLEYLSGYLVEKSLSIDNLFVFLLIFKALKIPRQFQHRLLFWGILGAIVLRAGMIYVGAELLLRFYWINYLFGFFLIVLGLKLFRGGEKALDPLRSPPYKLLAKYFPLAPHDRSGRFVVHENGRRLLTHAFVCLVLIESSDVIFALDSVPAVFGVTRDPYLVYTSNIFAILGLRSLYFMLEELLQKFHHLKTALAVILVFVGLKMCAEHWYAVSALFSLGFIVASLGVAVIFSMRTEHKKRSLF